MPFLCHSCGFWNLPTYCKINTFSINLEIPESVCSTTASFCITGMTYSFKLMTVIDKVFEELIDYTDKHFKEEAIFQNSHYPEKVLHQELIQNITQLKAEHNSEKNFISLSILKFLRGYHKLDIRCLK